MDYKYKFSVVIPVYNVEGYLAETLDSVIGQSMALKIISRLSLSMTEVRMTAKKSAWNMQKNIRITSFI